MSCIPRTCAHALTKVASQIMYPQMNSIDVLCISNVIVESSRQEPSGSSMLEQAAPLHLHGRFCSLRQHQKSCAVSCPGSFQIFMRIRYMNMEYSEPGSGGCRGWPVGGNYTACVYYAAEGAVCQGQLETAQPAPASAWTISTGCRVLVAPRKVLATTDFAEVLALSGKNCYLTLQVHLAYAYSFRQPCHLHHQQHCLQINCTQVRFPIYAKLIFLQ